MEVVMQMVFLLLGFAMLIKGADWFVDGASSIADRLGIPQLVIGLTIVALGTSAPETAVSISAALKGSAAITVGNVVGSNILNVLIILGITAVIRVISVQDSTVKYELPFLIFVSVLMTALGLYDNKISRLEGCILWICMIAYLVYLLKMARKGKEEQEEENTHKKDKVLLLIVMVVVGVVLIVIGSDISVDAATKLATIFGMSERLIGLTIVALGTSLPELVTSVTAALKGNSDIAVGNIVGSNIFNILFVAGTTAVITPVVYSSGFMIDSLVSIFAVALLYVLVRQNKKLGKIGGGMLLLTYVGYFIYLVLN